MPQNTFTVIRKSWRGFNAFIIFIILLSLAYTSVKARPLAAGNLPPKLPPKFVNFNYQFLKTFGYGVSSGTSAYEICTSNCQSGLSGTANGQFSYPDGVAIDTSTGNIFVVDLISNRVQIFDSNLNFLSSFGTLGAGAGNLSSPAGIAVDSANGILYLVNTRNSRIDKFTTAGVFVSAWGWGVSTGASALEVCTSTCRAGLAGTGVAQFNFSGAQGYVALNPVGDKVYVSDYKAHRVQVFSSAGAYIGVFGGLGSGAGNMNQPLGIAVDRSGNIYVGDGSNRRVDKFDSANNFVSAWGWGVSTGTNAMEVCTTLCQAGIQGSDDGQFFWAWGLAIDPAGFVHVSNSSVNNVQIFTQDGVYLARTGVGGTGSGQFNAPRGVAFDSSGDLYVADQYSQRVQKFSNTTALSNPQAVTMSQDGTPTAFALTLKAIDNNADTLTWSISSAATHGTASAAGTGYSKSIGYTPTNGYSGSDSFNVQVSDGALTATVTVNVTIQQANLAPKFVNFNYQFLKSFGYGVSTGASANEICTSNCQIGLTGSADGQFGNPDGIAIDTSTGNIFVVDKGNHRVEIFDSNLTYLSSFGSLGVGAGGMNVPTGIAVDSSNGLLYIMDANNRRVDKFTTAGVFISAWGWGVSTGANALEVCTSTCTSGKLGTGVGQFNSYNHQGYVALSPAGDKVYVSDSNAHRVQVFSSAGAYIGVFGGVLGVSGSGAGNMNYPLGIAVDRSGNIYVGDGLNNRVDKFDSSNTFVSAWGWGVSTGATAFEVCTTSCLAGKRGTGNGQFYWTWGLAIDPAGLLHVANGSGNNIQTFTQNGEYLGRTGGPGSGVNQFNWANGVALDSSGDLYVVDQGNYRVQKFNDTTALSNPQAVTMSQDGAPTAFALTLNAIDNNAEIPFWSIFSGATHGTASVSGTGNTKNIGYTPATGYFGSDSFVVQVSDGSFSTATITVNVTIEATTPVITEGASTNVTMSQDGSPTAFALTLHATDSNPADTLTWSISSAASHGSASASGTGSSKSISYTPTTGYSGSDSFIAQVSDGSTTDTITVNVTVEFVISTPVITEGTSTDVTMSQDSAPTAFALTLHATDSNPADTLTWSISSAATHGTASASGTGSSKSISYTPTIGYSGSDSFIVQVSDGNNADTITVNVTIEAVVISTPVITEGASTNVTMSQDGTPTAFALTLHATDSNPADTLTWSISSAATHGTASASGTGSSKSISYTPTADYVGSDSFIVQASDGSTADTITVNVTIESTTPVITEGASTNVTVTFTSPFALTLHATKSNPADTLTWTIKTQSQHGTASVSGTGSSKAVSYTPDNFYTGSDSFVVEVSDGTHSSTITVNVAVNRFRIFFPISLAGN